MLYLITLAENYLSPFSAGELNVNRLVINTTLSTEVIDLNV